MKLPRVSALIAFHSVGTKCNVGYWGFGDRLCEINLTSPEVKAVPFSKCENQRRVLNFLNLKKLHMEPEYCFSFPVRTCDEFGLRDHKAYEACLYVDKKTMEGFERCKEGL